MAQKYFAVRKGRIPGIYSTWDECKTQVHGFKEAAYKSFSSREEAEAFINNQDTIVAVGKEDTESCEEGTLIAYVDGSYISAKADQYAYGVVFLDKDGMKTASGSRQNVELAAMHNVAGEIHAAAYAMQYAAEQGYKKLYIYHDYEGIAKWCRGDWKTNKDSTKAYKEFYDGLKDRLEIHFVKVTGHSGVKYNEMADQLAKKALGILS